MAIDTLTDATFEPVNTDANGNISFRTCLNKLRRSFVGMHNKIYPVFVINDSGNAAQVSQKSGYLAYYFTTTTKNDFTIFTSDITKRTFLTSIYIANVSSVLADNTFIDVRAYPKGLSVRVIGFIPKFTTTLSQLAQFFPFGGSIELTPGSVITMANIFTAGTSETTVIIYGYTEEL